VSDGGRFALIVRCRHSWRIHGTCLANGFSESITMGIIAINRERLSMLLVFSPFLASALYIGGSSVGLLLVIVAVVLLIRG